MGRQGPTLTRSRNSLVRLREYLIAHKHLPDDFPLPALVHEPAQDKRNKEDPRAFCFVTPSTNAIFTSRELENLPLCFRLGILLHEIGHIAIHAFGGPESEVDVDLWATGISEAGYHYADCTYYPQDRTGSFNTVAPIVAANIECLDEGFTKMIMTEDFSEGAY